MSDNNTRRIRRQRRKDSGLCTECGKATDGKRMCYQCQNKANAYQRRRYSELRADFFSVYGSVCKCCGLDDVRFLTIDHVHGNGFEERKTLSPLSIYSRALREKESGEYQVLCWNCNCAKKLYGECPHATE